MDIPTLLPLGIHSATNSICSPRVGNRDDKSVSTCYSEEALDKLIDTYNKTNKAKIDKSNLRSKREKWETLKSKFQSQCKEDEVCWIKRIYEPKSADAKKLMNFFKPPRPNGKYTWLSTNDIYDVLVQYADIFPDFATFPPVPSDFRKLYHSMGITSLTTLYKQGKRRMGLVLNTDKHTQGGSHWVCIFVDMRCSCENPPGTASVEYYDSTADEQIVPDIEKYLKHLVKELKTLIKHPEEVRYLQNTVVHQEGDTECGVYCIHYILNRLAGRTFEQIRDNPIDDDLMNNYRDIFFR